jgi:phosphohistidine swiveling domain-containing protein
MMRHPLANPKWRLPEGGTAGRLTREATLRRLEENLNRAGVASWTELEGDRWRELFSAADGGELAAAIFDRFAGEEGRSYYAGCEAAWRDAPDRYVLRSEVLLTAPGAAFAAGVLGEGDNLFEHEDLTGSVLVVRHVSDVAELMKDGVPADTIGVIADAGGTTTAPILPEFAGILCLAGSVRSHLAIIAREFGVPALMGVALSRPLETGERITVAYSAPAVSVEAYYGEGLKPRADIRPAEPHA